MSYDVVIIGAGPTGLTLATILKNESVLIIEKESSIGGCHRVLREDSYFTEHAPRVYSSAYVNFKWILKCIGTDFDKLFQKYRIDLNNNTLSASEILVIVIEYFKKVAFIKNNNSMKYFCRNFKKESIDYIDRLCRLVDGADSSEFSVDKFLSLIDQSVFYNLYQPKIANDNALFKIWTDYLHNKDVSIAVNTMVTNIDAYNKQLITNDGKIIKFKKLILAIPPVDILKIAPIDAFIPQEDMVEFANSNKYISYISVTYHYNNPIIVKDIWGFPDGEWGIVFSKHYFDNTLIISSSVTIQNVKGMNGLIPNECSKDELIQEMFRQINKRMPDLPLYDKAILSPTVSYENGMWIDRNISYMDNISSTVKHLPTNSNLYPWLFNVGPHSGFSDYDLNSMETAVENAMKFLKVDVKPRITLSQIIRLILLFVLTVSIR